MELKLSSAALIALSLASWNASAHGGLLDSSGCHNDRKNGRYHCHRAASTPSYPASSKATSSSPKSSVVFKNCAEARAAGAAPVLASDPRYGKHLDRDGGGIGCE